MPSLPSANPMAAVIAIAEKMADILQKEREMGLEGCMKGFLDEPDIPETSRKKLRQPSDKHSDEL